MEQQETLGDEITFGGANEKLDDFHRLSFAADVPCFNYGTDVRTDFVSETVN